MAGIKLSPRYGVNPTIPTCFWCGEEKNEIAFMGRLGGKQDIEAPRRCVVDYEPCDKCKAKMARGITLLAFAEGSIPAGMKPIWPDKPNTYPVPKMVVISEDTARDLFKDEVVEEIIQKKLAFIPESIIDKIIENSKKGEQQSPASI